MIPSHGYMTVQGLVWDTQGKIFKCRLKNPDEDVEEYLEGTVLFLHKLTLSDDAAGCKNAHCKCSCHDRKESGSGGPFFEPSESFNESGFESFLEPDVSKGKIRFVFIS